MSPCTALLLFALAQASPLDAGSCHVQKPELDSSTQTGEPSTDSLYNLDSKWTGADGRVVSLGSLKGAPVVLAMVYTSCQAVCPLIVADLQRIERQLPPSSRSTVRFVLVSMDPARDTPQQLARYAAAHGLTSAHWSLLTSSADDVSELAAVLGVRYRQLPSGDFAHSNLITVLDARGVISYRQIGLRQDPAPAVAALAAMARRP